MRGLLRADEHAKSTGRNNDRSEAQSAPNSAKQVLAAGWLRLRP